MGAHVSCRGKTHLRLTKSKSKVSRPARRERERERSDTFALAKAFLANCDNNGKIENFANHPPVLSHALQHMLDLITPRSRVIKKILFVLDLHFLNNQTEYAKNKQTPPQKRKKRPTIVKCCESK